MGSWRLGGATAALGRRRGRERLYFIIRHMQTKESKKQQDEETKLIKRYAWIFGLAVFGIWSLTFLLFFIGKMDARGQFGDMFGAVNALFSGLAFAGLIITLFLQKNELSLQRDELKLTREEMTHQREEFEKENETLRYQRFENLFYNMLNLQQEIVAGLRYDYEEEEIILVPSGPENALVQDKRKVVRNVTGRDVFRYTFCNAKIYFNERDRMGNHVFVNGYKGFLNKEGLVAYDTTTIPARFDHYFRHLYKIIQFVDSQGFKYEEAYKYISLLRGTLSRYELVWIYYNALSFDKFKKLIEEYCLLKNIREDLLARCLETEAAIKKLGLTPKEISENGFSGYDFEFLLTDNPNDPSKYYLTAFWKKEEIKDAQDKYNSWKSFINKTQR